MPQRYDPVPCAVNTSLDTGRLQFAPVWRQWVAQWTQSEWINLAAAYHGAKVMHSSQYAGFAGGTLIEPGPKAFVATGYFNLALARTVEWPRTKIEVAEGIGLPRKLPAAMEKLWGGREPLCDADGIALGPGGLFMAFCGLRALQKATSPTITPTNAEAASRALGKALRAHLLREGRDFIEELPRLSAGRPQLEDLLLGNPLDAQTLTEALPSVAEAMALSQQDLFQMMSPYLTK